MELILGIDTGGTYTDAVLYDKENDKVLERAKSLTTKENLSAGISNSMDKLPQDLIKDVKRICLSTTLATNACVEGKGGNAKLILYGMDEKKAKEYGDSFGEYSFDDIICIETKSHFNGTIEKMPDFDEIRDIIKNSCSDCSAMAVVEMYSRQTGAVLEKKTRDIIKEVLNVPTVCGYELFDDLNYLKRGACALLNAKLIPLINDFINAVKEAACKRNLDVPIVIMRSDGSLMSLEYTKMHPIETLLSGPVASTIGAFHLAKIKDGIIVDMGGTTSDIAMVKDGKPIRVTGGIEIGKWQTFVKGLKVSTFGLGGDTGIRYENGKLYLIERRLIPLCTLAYKYPEVLSELKRIAKEHINRQFIHEFLVLQNEPKSLKNFTDEEVKLINVLKKGPVSIMSFKEAVGVNIHNINIKELEDKGIIMRSGLTPTDIMHIKGDFDTYSKEAAIYAAEFVSKNVHLSLNELCDKVYDLVSEKLYINLSRIFIVNKYKSMSNNIFEKGLDKLLHEEWINKKNNKESDEISFNLSLNIPLVGIGGPIHIFLDTVAEAFNAKSIVPKYSKVANALGAAVGQGELSIKVIVRPYYMKRVSIGYYDVYGKGISKRFEAAKYNEAVEFAKETAKNLALEEAKIRGFTGKLNFYTDVNEKYFSDSNLLDQVEITININGEVQ